jgi:hypothetical protein
MLQIFTRVGRWLGLVTPRVDFTVSPAALTAPIVPDAGLVVYTVDDNGFSVAETITSNAVRNRLCQDTFRIGRNVSGVSIAKGAAVYVFSGTNEKTNYKLARANAEATMPCVGITTAAAADNAYCQIMIVGVLHDIKTDYAGWNEGDQLYVDATTAGALTNVRPVHPNLAQWVGTIEYKDNVNGRILVAMQDLTGIEDGTNRTTFTIGDGAAGTKSLTFNGTANRSISYDSTNLSLGTGHVIVEGVTSTGATGTGKMVFDTSPTLVTPLLGTPTSGTLTNCTFPTLNQDTTGTASNVLTTTKSDNVDRYLTFVAANGSSSQGVDVGAAKYNALTGLITSTQFSGNLITNIVKPASDSTTAIQVMKADGTTSVLNVDTTNGYIGIGTTAPVQALEVVGNTWTTQYGTPLSIGGRRANGTISSPTAMATGQILLSLQGYGHNGTTWSAVAGAWTLSSEEAFTTIANGTRWVCSTTPNGAIAVVERFRVNNRGALLVNQTTDDTTSQVQVTGTVKATAFSGVALSQCSDYVAPTAWTPVLTFATPGDLNVAYSQQYGTYCKRGPLVTVNFTIVTSTFTWTTASSSLEITGLPYLSDATTGRNGWGSVSVLGITFPTGCTQITPCVAPNTQLIVLRFCGTTAPTAAASNTTSGVGIQLLGSIEYWV